MSILNSIRSIFTRKPTVAPEQPKQPLDVYIYQRLRDWGMPDYIAAAFMDSFVSESRLDVDVDEVSPLVPGSRGGKGIYQLTGPRRTGFENRYLGKWTVDNQLDYLFWELENTERRAWSIIRRTTSRKSAVRAITRYFLRPAVDNSDHRYLQWKGTVT